MLHTGDEPPRKARRSQLRRELLLFTACTTTSSPVPHGEPAGRPVASRSAPTLIGRKRQARAARLDGFGIGRPVARATSSHAAMACLRFVGQPRARAWSPATATASTSSASARKWVPDWVICAASASARSWLPARAIAWTSVFSRSGRCRRPPGPWSSWSITCAARASSGWSWSRPRITGARSAICWRLRAWWCGWSTPHRPKTSWATQDGQDRRGVASQARRALDGVALTGANRAGAPRA